MTGRERMLMTLRFEEPDRPPQWVTLFDLTEEAFGVRFPDVSDWETFSAAKRAALLDECMPIYRMIVDRYKWDALAVWCPWCDPDAVAAAKKEFGDEIMIGTMWGPNIWSIDYISAFHDWMQFSVDLVENPAALHDRAEELVQKGSAVIDTVAEAGADFVLLVDDVAYNQGPFISPKQFSEFVTPYLRRQVEHIASRGVIPMVHSDGNLMPVLDDYLSLGAACLHSIDPMAGMDIAVVKQRCQGKMALMGNVQCNLLQNGPKEVIRESVLYCLENASPGGGYIFSNSNTVFAGMPLENYEYMMEVYWEFCGRGK
ncbi:MAG: uroporphyrinogen decarboxylase family protein [Planctomycetota bacterium]|jgi:uroporphyrinogen decarboxylase